jgi:competence protein ComEA
MKKQNLIIIGIFLVVVFGFYLISCNDSVEIEDNIFLEDETYVTVIVRGEVYREGEYTVPSDWTLEDLFNYVGVKNKSDLSAFDLTVFVEDGMTYFVSGSDLSNINYNSKININTASKEMLMTLKGIGESTANKIINYRNNNPFESIEDIKKVSGIGDFIYEKIKDFITV